MKKLGMIAVMVAALVAAGCATMRLPEGATQAEKEAAYCADARQACALAEIALATAATAEQQQYWTKYLLGAEKAINLYCGGEK